MLKTLIGLAIIILLTVLVVNAHSQQPTPTPGEISKPIQEQTTDKQQKTAADQRGTEQSPFVVKTINPPNNQAQADEERKERKEKAANNRKLIWFTGALVLFTAVLAGTSIWQGWQLKRSVDSLRNAERAHLFVMVQHPKDISHVKSFCEFTVVNAGRTPAILNNVNGSYEKVAFEDTIPEISPEGDHGIVPDTIIIGIGAGDSKSFTAKNAQAFNVDNRLVCIGRIQYKDIFEDHHETGFCWEYNLTNEEFRPINDPKCNYRT